MLKIPLIFTLILFFTMGCVPDPEKDLTPNELDSYKWFRDPTVDYSSFRTFFIKDSSHSVRDHMLTTDGSVIGFNKNSTDSLIYHTIREELESRGYQQVFSLEEADLGFSFSKVERNYPEREYHGVEFFFYFQPSEYTFPEAAFYMHDFQRHYTTVPLPFRPGSIGISVVTGRNDERNKGLISWFKPDLDEYGNIKPPLQKSLLCFWFAEFIDGKGKKTNNERTIHGIREMLKKFSSRN